MTRILWTPEMEATLRKCKAQHMSHSAIARHMGMTRSAISGKLWRGTNPKLKQLAVSKIPEISWDRKLFEPWAVRKARFYRRRASRMTRPSKLPTCEKCEGES